jgi:ribonuclease III
MNNLLESLTEENRSLLEKFQEEIGYKFSNIGHLQQSLVHSSFAFERYQKVRMSNETLEFLGDAVLGLVIGEALFKRFPEMREGALTKLRSALVNESHLALMAREINLGEYLLLGRGETASSGKQKSSILSCGYEAVIGAVFTDSSYDEVAGFINNKFEKWYVRRNSIEHMADPKSRLQEYLQEKFNQAPKYKIEKTAGPEHDKFFTASVSFKEEILALGNAGSKKEAEQDAAARALKILEEKCQD